MAGSAVVQFDSAALREVGLVALDAAGATGTARRFAIDPGSLQLAVADGRIERVLPGRAGLSGRMMLSGPNGGVAVLDRMMFRFAPFQDGSAFQLIDAATGMPAFDVLGVQYTADDQIRFILNNADLAISEELGNQLGIAAGTLVGTLRIDAETALAEAIVEHADVSDGAAPDNGTRDSFPVPGADVIVGDLPATQQVGRQGTIGSGTIALALATTSCNKGLAQLLWQPLPDSDHPVIAQNLYRLYTEGGYSRFEHIGQSFVKHGFCALQGNICFTCTPAGGGCPQVLGSGCSDPYDVSLNATQTRLGARSYVNPYTGAFPSNATNHPTATNDIQYRLQVLESDLTKSGASYYSEGIYVHPQEFQDGNQFNNASYRRVTKTGPNGSGTYTFTNVGSTVREEPAMSAWTTATRLDLKPSQTDGRAVLGYQVTDLGNGVWHYEFALWNRNLHDGFNSFSVPVPDCVNVTNIDFHAVRNTDVESTGQVFSNDPWTVTTGNGAVTWSCPTEAQNVNANALRWGTLFNFRFDADSPSVRADLTLGLYRSGTTAIAVAVGPGAPACPEDLDNSGDIGPQDLALLLASWEVDTGGDIDCNGQTGAQDLALLLAAWEQTCP